MSMDEPVIGQTNGEPTLDEPAEDLAATPLAEAFRPGNSLQVAYSGPNRRPAFNSAVAGVTPGSVELELTRLPREQAPPRQGDDVVLVARNRVGFEAFDAHVIEVGSALVVTSPVEARRPERRMALRVPVAVPLRSGVWLDPHGGEYPIDRATLIDVSVGGVQLRAQQFVAPGSIMRLAFALHPGERPVLVQGMVIAVTNESKAAAHSLHVVFIEMPDDSREQVERFVKRARARSPKAGSPKAA